MLSAETRPPPLLGCIQEMREERECVYVCEYVCVCVCMCVDQRSRSLNPQTRRTRAASPVRAGSEIGQMLEIEFGLSIIP